MTQKALDQIGKTHGWEIGIGLSVAVADRGTGSNLTTLTLQEDVYSFIFNQQGLMAGVSVEGTRLYRIHQRVEPTPTASGEMQ